MPLHLLFASCSPLHQSLRLTLVCERVKLWVPGMGMDKLDFFHNMEVLFPKYFQSISRIFPYHGQHIHTMELDKTMEIGFSKLFLQYFQNIFPYNGPIFSVPHTHLHPPPLPPHPRYIICHSMCTSFMNPTNLSAIHLSDVNKNQECCVEQVTAEVSCFD